VFNTLKAFKEEFHVITESSRKHLVVTWLEILEISAPLYDNIGQSGIPFASKAFSFNRTSLWLLLASDMFKF